MCVNTKRAAGKNSRNLQYAGSGPKRGTAVLAEGSYAQSGAATGFSFGKQTYENRADAEAASVAKFKADEARPATVNTGGFYIPNQKRLTVGEQRAAKYAQKNNGFRTGAFMGVRKPAAPYKAPETYAEIVKATLPNLGGFGVQKSAYQITSGVKQKVQTALDTGASKARPAAKAPDPVMAPAPAAATSATPQRKRLRIRPGSAPSASASLGKTGINIPN